MPTPCLLWLHRRTPRTAGAPRTPPPRSSHSCCRSVPGRYCPAAAVTHAQSDLWWQGDPSRDILESATHVGSRSPQLGHHPGQRSPQPWAPSPCLLRHFPETCQGTGTTHPGPSLDRHPPILPTSSSGVQHEFNLDQKNLVPSLLQKSRPRQRTGPLFLMNMFGLP